MLNICLIIWKQKRVSALKFTTNFQPDLDFGPAEEATLVFR